MLFWLVVGWVGYLLGEIMYLGGVVVGDGIG